MSCGWLRCMGNTFCMTTPDTAVATGSPVKLMTYTGVPLHALVAYERAALDLPHDVPRLQREVTQCLLAAEQPCAAQTQNTTGAHRDTPAAAAGEPFFSRAALHMFDGAHASSERGSTRYVDGVPVWVQEVAQRWNASAPHMEATTWRAEQEAAWASGSAQLLRDFTASQKFAKALQHVRKKLKSLPRHSDGPFSSPLVFAELMRSYETLSRNISCRGGSVSCSGSAAGETSLTPSMWCGLLCRFLRGLPEPLMPALCSRRLEPLLAAAPAQCQRADRAGSAAPFPSPAVLSAPESAALKVLRDSFVSTRVVDFVTLCFVLTLTHQHRAELTGGELEAVAEALLRESAVPHVVRAIAHACKPEARMFWPATEKPSGTSTSTAVARSREERPAEESPQRAGEAHAESEAAGHGGMVPPSSKDDSDSASDDGSSSSSSDEASSAQEDSGHEKPQPAAAPVEAEGSTMEERDGAPPHRQPSDDKTPPSGTAGQIMRWHDSTSSSSFSTVEEEKNEDDDDAKNNEGEVSSDRFGKVANSSEKPPCTVAPCFVTPPSPRPLTKQPTTAPHHNAVVAVAAKKPTMTVAGTTAASTPPAAHLEQAPPPSSSNNAAAASGVRGVMQRTLHHPAGAATATTSTTNETAAAAAMTTLADTTSLADMSPVRKNDVSLLSRLDRDGTVDFVGDTRVSSAFFSRNEPQDATRERAYETLPSPLVSQSEPSQLHPQFLRSALYPSVPEEALAKESVMEGLGRALHPFGNAPASGSVPSRSLGAEHSNNGGTRDGNPSAVSMVPSLSLGSGVVLTPRNEGRQQQQQQHQQERPPLPSTAPAAALTTTTTKDTSEAANNSPPAPPVFSSTAPYRAQRAQPLVVALLEAKQRFLAAPVSTSIFNFVTASASPVTESAGVSPNGCAATEGVSVKQDDAARLRRVLVCAREQGWSPDDLLAALQSGQHGPPSQSSLTTPQDATAPTSAAAAAMIDSSALGQSDKATSSLSAIEKELRRLREMVSALETSQFVQMRQASAQTSVLTARCAELQRQQHEQEQHVRFAQSSLKDVQQQLEDLKDDKARLQMQLTTARQEGAQLRDALLTGRVQV